MKREIKFRGKSNDVWVYGSLCTKYENEPESVYIIDDSCTYHKVDEESVGQFIGLSDMNGREIYEGDTVKWHNRWLSQVRNKGDKLHNRHGNVIGKIEWERQAGAFWLKWQNYNKNHYKEMMASYGDGEQYRIDNFEVLVEGAIDLFSNQ
jgi:hypothetical protein